MPLTTKEIFHRARRGEISVGHLIPGNTSTTSRFENNSPIDNRLIGYIAAGDFSHVEVAVRAARRTFIAGEWAQKTPADRKRVMLTWANLIEKHSQEIAALDCVDAGKPIAECLSGDVPTTIEFVTWYAEAVDKCYGRIAPTGSSSLGLIIKEPIGVVGAVLPWNYPAQTYAMKVAPALAAGNSVIVKPAELTSLSAFRLTQLAHEAGVPEGALTLVTGTGNDAGEPLGRHPDVDMVSFTGSTDVGRLFLTYAAESNLKEIVLECGGKSAQIVFDDADLTTIVNEILSAAFTTMGENCTAGSRLIVHSSIKDALLDRLGNALSDWRVGLPTDPTTKIGPMVEKAHFDKVKSYLDSSSACGASLVYGGHIHNTLGSGWYIEPTIYDKVSPDMPLFRDEIFGPILTVTTFETEKEAILLANDSVYGLAASLYTRDINRARRVSQQIRAGTVAINGYTEGDVTVPLGGYKLSGFGGRDKGLEAFDQYTQTKVIWYANN